MFPNKWPRYGYNYEADGILGDHLTAESQPDQQHHQPCNYHSYDAPASAVSNENSSDSTIQGLVEDSTAASTAGSVSECCETVETAALTARRMVSWLEAESVLELAMYTATCLAALNFLHLMCPPAAEVAQMCAAHDLALLLCFKKALLLCFKKNSAW